MTTTHSTLTEIATAYNLDRLFDTMLQFRSWTGHYTLSVDSAPSL